MKKLIWLTDIHLNFLEEEERAIFYDEILKSKGDAVLITGDIAEAPTVVELLSEMAAHIKKPIYFVVGNHDYYRGKISEVREALTTLTQVHEQLFWLPASGIQALDHNTILLGQDAWADGRLGDYQNSRVTLNDSRLIADLHQATLLGKTPLLEKMQSLADIDARNLEIDLSKALALNPQKIIVLTHVPPFQEVCLYNEQFTNDNWLPFFSSKATGDVLLRAATNSPAVEFVVLCGHTHSKANYKPLANLSVNAGQAEYYQPEIQKLITL